MKEIDIEDKYYRKHDKLLKKVKTTPEYQRLRKVIEKIEKNERKKSS